MSDFLRSLDSTVRLEQGYSRQTSFFDTHPSTPERVAEATTQAVVRRWTPKFSIAKSREDYLQRIEGLPIGKPANEGVLRDGRFMHPDMNISLAFPHGWHVENERSRVIAFAPERDAIVLLELQGRGMDLRAAVRKYAAEEGIRLSQGKLIRIGPLDALRTQGMVPTSAGSFEMEITFVAYEGQVYRLSAGARQGKFQRYAGVFRGFARSFRSLRKDESALIDEVRLRLVRVREDEDLAVLSERTGNTWDLNRTAIMNGLTIGDDLEVGLLIKVAIREAYVPPPAPVSVEPEPSGSESTGDSQVSPPEPVSSEDAG